LANKLSCRIYRITYRVSQRLYLPYLKTRKFAIFSNPAFAARVRNYTMFLKKLLVRIFFKLNFWKFLYKDIYSCVQTVLFDENPKLCGKSYLQESFIISNIFEEFAYMRIDHLNLYLNICNNFISFHVLVWSKIGFIGYFQFFSKSKLSTVKIWLVKLFTFRIFSCFVLLKIVLIENGNCNFQTNNNEL
jgi:hypothetical protein